MENTQTEEGIQNVIHKLDSLPGKSGKLKPIESTPTNVSFDQLFLDKVKLIYTGKTENESNET